MHHPASTDLQTYRRCDSRFRALHFGSAYARQRRDWTFGVIIGLEKRVSPIGKWGVQLFGGVFGGAVEINIDIVIRVLFCGNAINDVGTV